MPITLKTHQTFEIPENVTLILSNDIDSYPFDPKREKFIAMITSKEADNISIIGKGKIDGQGALWWLKYKSKQLNMSRPYLIEIFNCNGLNIHDITIENAPMFGIVPTGCKNVEISGVTILAPKYDEAPNTDGIDIVDTQYAHVHNVYVASGDDCVAAKMNAKHVLVENSKFGHCLGATVGTGYNNSNITFRKIKFDNTKWGVRVKFHDYGVGFSKDIVYEDLEMNNVEHAVTVNQFGQANDNGINKGKKLKFVDISGITVRNVVGENIVHAGHLLCSKDLPCHGIVLENIHLNGKILHKPDWSCTYCYGKQNDVKPRSCVIEE